MSVHLQTASQLESDGTWRRRQLGRAKQGERSGKDQPGLASIDIDEKGFERVGAGSDSAEVQAPGAGWQTAAAKPAGSVGRKEVQRNAEVQENDSDTGWRPEVEGGRQTRDFTV